MSIWAALFLLAAVWCLIHVLHFFTNRPETSLLPTQSHSTRRGLLFTKLPHLKITLKGLQLQVSTTQWNTTHDKLSSLLSRRGHKTLAACVLWFYNLGTLLGGVGMLVAVLALCWVCVTAGWAVFQKIVAAGDVGYNITTPPDMGRLMKRSTVFSEGEGSTPSPTGAPSGSFPSITPIIPGVTVPLNHLPVIIAAVFISQVVHELGHALAAALEFLPMTACGASFTVCIPAAFVSFPAGGMKALPAKARSRIIAAGPYHNLVMWAFLVLATRSGVVHLASFVSGYRDISNIGKVVVQVNPESPLSLHLQSGSIITQLDDTSLASDNYGSDMWSAYLQGTMKNSSLGWCIAKTILAKTDDCCTNPHKIPSFSCFVSRDTSERGCMDPVPVLTSQHNQIRCQSSGQCTPEATCVVPAKDTQLLRLTVRPSISDVDDLTVVLWSGPPVEIWEEVQVSAWVPRIWVLPLWIPPLVATFWEYLTMATLSLYFFNLLPLPHLDGMQLLHSFLDWAFDIEQGTVSYNFGALEEGESDRKEPRTRRRWKQMILKYSPYAVSGIVICSVLVSILNAIY